MNRRFFDLSVLILALMFALPMIVFAEKEGFQQIADNLDLKKNTKLHVKEYWKEIDGKGVTWSGSVFDVKGGRGKVQILVSNKARRTVNGYNIVLISHDTEKATKLRKGQQIRFKGIIHDYKANKDGGVVIILKEAEIL